MVIPVPSFLIPVPSVETCGNVKSLSGLVLYTAMRQTVDQGGSGVGGVYRYLFFYGIQCYPISFISYSRQRASNRA